MCHFEFKGEIDIKIVGLGLKSWQHEKINPHFISSVFTFSGFLVKISPVASSKASKLLKSVI
jgi:hypothetical protein